MTILAGNRHKDDTNTQLKKWATVASISVAILLVSAKTAAYLATNSVSLLSSLMDSCFDAVASLVTMISVIHAASPADEDHRFGHGKVEALGALAQAVFIAGSSLFLMLESVSRFLSPQDMRAPAVGISVMVLSIVLTSLLLAFQSYVVRRTKSVGITADQMHYKGDLLMNLSVLAALGLSYYFKSRFIDPVFALVIGIMMLNSARGVLKHAFDILMDKELSDDDREKIINLVTRHPDAVSVHDLRTRSTGDKAFIEFHLELDGDMTLKRVHDVTDEIETLLFDAFPRCEVIIHQEPAGIDDERLDHRIKGK